MGSVKENLIADSAEKPVRAGDVVHFGYGIPPVGVDAPIIERDGVLVALTPDHTPRECRLSKLKGYVGDFYKIEAKPRRVEVEERISSGIRSRAIAAQEKGAGE